jgi:hypothetical protein
MRVIQEFFCNKCFGYFRATLNMALNINVKIECPNCHAQHQRMIKDGLIYDNGKVGEAIHIIIPMKSTYTKEAVLKKSHPNMRDGMPFGDPSKDLINESWNERYGDKV